MNEAKFTPGPWGLEPESDGTEMVAYSSNPWRIRSVIFRNFEWHDPNSMANMRLIAAAPDLYEALKSMVVMMDDGDEPGSDSPWHTTATAALNKAEGKVSA